MLTTTEENTAISEIFKTRFDQFRIGRNWTRWTDEIDLVFIQLCKMQYPHDSIQIGCCVDEMKNDYILIVTKHGKCMLYLKPDGLLQYRCTLAFARRFLSKDIEPSTRTIYLSGVIDDIQTFNNILAILNS